jgi:glycosyltransferase involved in cell wall biosynthesis
MTKYNFSGLNIVVIIPCYNEESTVGFVIRDFQKYLPAAKIYVFDNNSTDKTVEIAKDNGAIVRFEKRQGKGNVVRRAFFDIDADIYILIDGDNTYSVADAPEMLRQMYNKGADYVNGARITQAEKAYRVGHKFGNKLFSWIVAFVFGNYVTDMLSGYKVLSRRFVKSFPIISGGFEIETELMIHALRLRMPIDEVKTVYHERPVGSVSKLSTYEDGFKILMTIFKLIETERPFLFWGITASFFGIISFVLGIPLIMTYLQTGLVPRFPTAFLCGFLGLASLFSLFMGIILDHIQQSRYEAKQLFYLSIPCLKDDKQNFSNRNEKK